MRVTTIALLAMALYQALPAVAADALIQASSAATAQAEPLAGNTYKLTFVVRELAAGKITGSRTYSALHLDNSRGQPGSIRAGNRVPAATGHGLYQYQDVGVNIDFNAPIPLSPPALPNSHVLTLHIAAEVSSIAPGEPGASAAPPLLRQQRWNSNFVLELGKPTLVFSSDDPVADRTTQIELTAVKVQ